MRMTKNRVAGVIAKCLLLFLRTLVLDTTFTTILFLTHLIAGGIAGTTNDIIYGSTQGPKVHKNVAEPERLAGACRVAVCLSGHIRSFVHPIVHISIRRNLVDAMREDGCEVDVFAYASSGDTVASLKKHLNSEFTPDASDVDAALAYLAPVRIAWHQEQAGIIPNACPDEMNSHGNSTGAGNGGAWWERYKFEASQNLFWQLYKSRAAYHMALDEETRRGGGFSYNWIIRARFDVAWVRPIPSIRRFPRDAVYFHSHYWPMSDQFALVPRALADRFFSAVAAFYACDGVSWPPPVSWWQPNCHGMSFEESVLFRHIHAVGIPYRLFSMFEYAIARGEGGGVCKLGTSDYIHTCNVLVGLSTGMLLKPPLDRSDCIITLAEWANLRCRALFSTGGEKDPRRVNAILDRNPASWENLIRNPFPSNAEQPSAADDRAKSTVSAHITYPPTMEELDNIRSRMIALRDALLAPSSSGLNKNGAIGSGDSTGESLEERRKWDRWEGFETTPSWWIFSPSGCPITEYPGRAPHLVMYYTVGESLKREVAGALKCQINRLIGGDIDRSSCDSIRSIEEVTIDVALHTEELGVCTVDGSLGLSPDDHAQRFFRNPTAHCVGYGKLIEENEQLPR